MIPISTYNIMIVFDMALIFYAFIDNRSALYTDIAASFAAAILSTYLGIAIRTDIVREGVGTSATVVNSESLGLVLIFAGVCMFVFTIYKIAQIIRDALEQKKEMAIARVEQESEL